MGKHRRQALTVLGVNMKKVPGYYADSDGLYLRVAPGGSKTWTFFFTIHGRRREMGLGSVVDKSLAVVREDVHQYRLLLLDGVDPIDQRAKQRKLAVAAIRKVRTFRECAAEYHAMHSSGWRNRKHGSQWIDSLVTHAFPVLGDKDVNDIGKSDILAVLEPIWLVHHPTAARVRQRIRVVLDWASARDFRTTQDPHLWDQITRSLPRTKDVRKPRHFAACPYDQVSAFIQTIRVCGASPCVKQAMELTILTAARTGMVRLAIWEEFDLEKGRWTIPAARMKAGVEHRVPLSPRALEILHERVRIRTDKGAQPTDLVFPTRSGKAHSDMAFTMQLRRLGMNFTMHGFRSTFRDWAAEQTSFPAEVCEAALAHSLKDATEAAYFRSDLFEKRRELMVAWAEYCRSVQLG